MCKPIPHKYNCPHLCAFTDVLADECTATAIETSVGVVLMNVCATVVIDALTGGTVGAGIDMLVRAEIIVVAPAIVASKFTVAAAAFMFIGESIDARADVLVGT